MPATLSEQGRACDRIPSLLSHGREIGLTTHTERHRRAALPEGSNSSSSLIYESHLYREEFE